MNGRKDNRFASIGNLLKSKEPSAMAEGSLFNP